MKRAAMDGPPELHAVRGGAQLQPIWSPADSTDLARTLADAEQTPASACLATAAQERLDDQVRGALAQVLTGVLAAHTAVTQHLVDELLPVVHRAVADQLRAAADTDLRPDESMRSRLRALADDLNDYAKEPAR